MFVGRLILKIIGLIKKKVYDGCYIKEKGTVEGRGEGWRVGRREDNNINKSADNNIPGIREGEINGRILLPHGIGAILTS